MRIRSRVYFGASFLLIFVLAACGGGGDQSARQPSSSATPTSTAGSAAMGASSSSAAGPAGTAGAVASRSTTPSEGSGVVTTSDGLHLKIATPTGNQPVVKNVPSQPPRSNAAAIGEPRVRSTFDADHDGFLTYTELQQSIIALYPSYQWPARYRVDLATLTSGYAAYAKTGRFQDGAAYTIIGNPHQCAWEKAWLDGYAAGDNGLMEQSMEQLETVALSNPMFIYMRDDLKEMFQRAELGDPALIQQDVTYNCGGFTFITPASTPPDGA